MLTSHLEILLKCRLWFQGCGVGPESLYFQQALQWCGCCWSVDHTLSRKGLTYVSAFAFKTLFFYVIDLRDWEGRWLVSPICAFIGWFLCVPWPGTGPLTTVQQNQCSDQLRFAASFLEVLINRFCFLVVLGWSLGFSSFSPSIILFYSPHFLCFVPKNNLRNRSKILPV